MDSSLSNLDRRTLETVTRPQGASVLPDGSLHWCVWAPRSENVRLVIWPAGQRREEPMQPIGDGYFEFVLPPGEWGHGLRYAYRVAGADLDLPDPVSRWQPDGVHQPSAVLDPRTFTWHNSTWPGLRQTGLVIYELHVGTFTDEGTFEAIIPRLAALVELGVTAIEIMPVAQFPGDRNWGYDGVHLYAAQNSYGGPLGFARLVDAAQVRRLGRNSRLRLQPSRPRGELPRAVRPLLHRPAPHPLGPGAELRRTRLRTDAALS